MRISRWYGLLLAVALSGAVVLSDTQYAPVYAASKTMGSGGGDGGGKSCDGSDSSGDLHFDGWVGGFWIRENGGCGLVAGVVKTSVSGTKTGVWLLKSDWKLEF